MAVEDERVSLAERYRGYEQAELATLTHLQAAAAEAQAAARDQTNSIDRKRIGAITASGVFLGLMGSLVPGSHRSWWILALVASTLSVLFAVSGWWP